MASFRRFFNLTPSTYIFLNYLFKTIVNLSLILGICASSSLRLNNDYLFYVSVCHGFSSLCLVFVVHKKPNLLDFCSFYIAFSTIVLATEAFIYSTQMHQYLVRNTMILIMLILLNEKYKRFYLQITFISFVFLYLEVRNFTHNPMYYLTAFLVMLGFVILIYHSWIREKNIAYEYRLYKENQEFIMLYQSIIKNYPSALISFQITKGSSRNPDFQLSFANEIAKRELRIDNNANLLAFLEDIKVYTNNLFNFDMEVDFSSEKNFLQNHLLDFSPRPTDDIILGIEDKSPQIKKFFITYKRRENLRNHKDSIDLKDLKSSQKESKEGDDCKDYVEIANGSGDVIRSEKNIEKGTKYRICLIRFYHQDKLTFLLNMEDIHLEEEVIHLREIDKTKDEMLASITHDLRSPLATMLKCIEFAKESDDLVEKHYNLDLAKSSGMMLMNLISDILDYSMMKKGRFKLNLSFFPLEKLIEETISMMKVQTNMKNIILSINNNIRSSAILFSDYLRIKQVLVNLITNSLKFTNSGGEIILDLSHGSDPNLIIFSVIDNGIGIKQEIIPKLCKPFHTYDFEGSYNKHGIGLGLHICTNIINQLGPEKSLRIESNYGKGSKFSFVLFMNCGFRSEILIERTLRSKIISVDTCSNFKEAISEHNSQKNIPYIQRKDSHENFINVPPLNRNPLKLNTRGFRPPVKQTSSGDAEEHLFHLHQREMMRIRSDSFGLTEPNEIASVTVNVLLADDDVFTIMVMKRMLSQYGEEHKLAQIKIEVAYNGEEAIGLFRKRNCPGSDFSTASFNLVILDCMMPIKDGFAAACEMKRLMEEEKFRKSLIYGCSSLEAYNKTIEKEGFDDFLIKPVDKIRVFHVLQQVIQDKTQETFVE